jgi:hypothetical protein
MWVLIIILVLFGLILMLTTYISRRKKTGETEITINEDGECCGVSGDCRGAEAVDHRLDQQD